MSHCIGTDSEVGRLRTVLVHRPGAELMRITPRTKARLRFDGIPWVARAQQEHDALTDMLREHGAEVVYVTELLQDVLEYATAREASISSVLANSDLGDDLGRSVGEYLAALPPEDLAAALIVGLTRDELRSGRGLVSELLDPRDFVVEPLPNLVFNRDAGVWIGDQPVVARLPGPRRRETDLMGVVYAHHPRFAGIRHRYLAGRGALDGGDIVLLAPGAVAIGVGVGTTPATAERLARHLLGSGAAHTVLAVPMSQRGQGSSLGRVCTVVDTGYVIMSPSSAFTLTALTITARQGDLYVSHPRPFLEAAAMAIGIDALKVIETGLDSRAGAAGQWDDGGNALALGEHVTACSERNGETNARLEAAGFEVVTVPCGELGGLRGGPRSMCSPIEREPVMTSAPALAVGLRVPPARPGLPVDPGLPVRSGPPERPVTGHEAGLASADGSMVPGPAEPADPPDPASGATRREELTPSR